MSYEEVSYEGYGPGGVAILIETLTDNRNRTVAEIRHLFSKSGGNLGENGCVAWMFDKRGLFAIDSKAMSEEAFMDLAVELDAEDISIEDEVFEIYSQPESFANFREELDKREVQLITKELAMLPQNLINVDADKVPQLLRLLEALEDQEDVQNVWANFDIDTEVLAAQLG